MASSLMPLIKNAKAVSSYTMSKNYTAQLKNSLKMYLEPLPQENPDTKQSNKNITILSENNNNNNSSVNSRY